MSNIEKFEDFLNERKSPEERRADRKARKAEKKLDKAEDAFEEGRDKKGERKLRKAKKKLDKAEELNPELDTAEIEAEIKEIEDTDWEDEFDIVSSKLGRKVKSRDFEYITKVKVKGDEISPEETILFLKSVQSYINEFWDDIEDDKGKEEYLSPHDDDMILKVKNRANKIVFVYSEGGITDKAKLVIDKEVFEDEDNKEELNDEIDKLIGTEHFVGDDGKIDKNYRPEKDVIKIATPAIITKELDNALISADNKLKKEFVRNKQPNQAFIKAGVDMLVEEKLNLGGVSNFANTDEERIYKFFVKTNATHTINEKNIDAILLGYKRRKSQMKENNQINEYGLGDFWDDTKQVASDVWDGTKKVVKGAWQSMAGTESKGAVQDLMWAFNTNAGDISKRMDSIISKLSDGMGEKITTEVVDKAENIKKEVATELQESATSHAIAGAGGAMALKGAGTGMRMGGAIGRGLLWGVRLIPVWGWIAGAIIGGGYWMYNTFDTQEYQLANIFLLMYASQSKQFLKEMEVAGIRINEDKKLNIDFEKIKSSVMSGEMYEREAEENEEISDRRVKSFESYYVTNKIPSSYVSPDHSAIDDANAYNSIMFNMSVTDEEENVIFNENVDSDKIKELRKNFKDKGYKITVKKVKKED